MPHPTHCTLINTECMAELPLKILWREREREGGREREGVGGRRRVRGREGERVGGREGIIWYISQVTY